MSKKVLLLINTGTPQSPGTGDVRRYLSQFLGDGRVIDIPWLLRKILVNLIIVPFRAPRSARLYNKLWTREGSPLLVNLKGLTAAVQKQAGPDVKVIAAMRYGKPSLKKVLTDLEKDKPREIIIFPLFPQYASSTSGSILEAAMKTIKKWNTIPSIELAGQFYSHPLFIDAFAAQISKYQPEEFDHVLFSYHGLPLRHIERIHKERQADSCRCTEEMPDDGFFCYKAACYETTRLLAARLNLPVASCSTSFQSRFSDKWLSPFTDKVLEELAHSGKKRVLITAPSFVADCLETIVELGDEGRHIFEKAGGTELVLAESLNQNKNWAEAVYNISGIRNFK